MENTNDFPISQDPEEKKELTSDDEVLNSAHSASSAHHENGGLQEDQETDFGMWNTPTFSEEIYDRLPDIIRRATEVFDSQREKDVFLTGLLSAASGCFPKATGTYAQKTVCSNLMGFIVAPPASGKGVLIHAREMLSEVHRELVQQSEQTNKKYIIDLAEYKRARKSSPREGEHPPSLPVEPPFRTLFIPGNSSTAAIVKQLNDNEGIGIMLETEADTLTISLRQEWGNFSDLLRKAFHHETISYSRKTNREHIEILYPKLSVVLSGTPDQVPSLIRSVEDGLFSRFLFYCYKGKPQWRDVSPCPGCVNLTNLFKDLAQDFLNLYMKVRDKGIVFNLTPEQWERLNNRYAAVLPEISNSDGLDSSASVFRLGLIQFRLAMVLSIIRNTERGSLPGVITCNDDDFGTAEELCKVYLKHMLCMLEALPRKSRRGLGPNVLRFFEALPAKGEFNAAEAKKIGVQIGVQDRTVDKYLKVLRENGYLKQERRNGPYRKS